MDLRVRNFNFISKYNRVGNRLPNRNRSRVVDFLKRLRISEHNAHFQAKINVYIRGA